MLIEFFRAKSQPEWKAEDREESWYADWIAYQARHRLYADLLSPAQYSELAHSLDLLRLTRFLEILAYFSPAHAYSLHVTFLGLFPILLGENEALKVEAIRRLNDGGLFALGVSEKTHGSDLLANEFTVCARPPDGWLANGSKYYIGNANSASVVTILARKLIAPDADRGRRAPFVLFALRPRESPGYQDVRKIRTLGIRRAFVGEFTVKDHPCDERDFLAEGRAAWNAIASTVDFGKFFLGFGSLGICAHALAEALEHMGQRVLYGRPVTDMPHIRQMVTSAFARLAAMRLYAFRALDYLQFASEQDRRYLLFNAVQKAKVSTEGVKVMALLSECIGARGFEADTYFESALREAPMVPGLEGSTHINLRLSFQFLENYFELSDRPPAAPASLLFGEAQPFENPYWFAGGERNPRKVAFPDFGLAYEPLNDIPNVAVFRKQVQAFARFAAVWTASAGAGADMAVAIAAGKCLATIAYGQLVAENCRKAAVAPPLASVIFGELVEDLTADALRLSARLKPRSKARPLLLRVVRTPRSDLAEIEAVFDIVASRYAGTHSD